MKLTIAIPTYNRSDVLEKKTLTTLLKGGIEPKQIYIFVANQKEKKIYEDAIPRDKYNEMIVGKLGITNQRKFIKNYFVYFIRIYRKIFEYIIKYCN